MSVIVYRGHDTPPQWHQNPSHPTLDGFTIRRTGDTPTKIRLILLLQQYPEQFRVLPELGRAYFWSSTRAAVECGTFSQGIY